MIYLVKRFSEISNSIPTGISYITEGFLLDPLDKAATYIDNTNLGKMRVIKKKTNLTKRLTRPIKKFISYQRSKRK